jgi:hypothetical protein
MECADARILLSQALDGALPPHSAAALDRHLEDCAACRSFRAALTEQDQLLREAWPAVAAPAGFAARVSAALPPRPSPAAAPAAPARSPTGLRWLLPRPALAAAGLALLLLLAVAVPPVRAGLGQLLHTVVLRESEPPATPPSVVRLTRRSLEEAQALVPWRIRRPSPLPQGYRLVAVYADELHSFAAGATVVLEYQRDGSDAPSLRLTELRLADPTYSPADEPVAPGAARAVAVDGRPGLLIDGEWQTRGGRQEWVRGRLLRLIVEDGDLLFQLEADSRAGWDADHLIAVAATLR